MNLEESSEDCEIKDKKSKFRLRDCVVGMILVPTGGYLISTSLYNGFREISKMVSNFYIYLN